MKMYVKPEMEISKFSVEDIMTASGVAGVVENSGFAVRCQFAKGIDVSELIRKADETNQSIARAREK